MARCELCSPQFLCMFYSLPAAKVKRMVVSTYQAASGAGQAAMEELEQQTREVLEGEQSSFLHSPVCGLGCGV